MAAWDVPSPAAGAPGSAPAAPAVPARPRAAASGPAATVDPPRRWRGRARRRLAAVYTQPPVLTALRAVAGRAQARVHAALMAEAAGLPAAGDAARARVALAARAAGMRPVHGDGPPAVIGIGHDDWEMAGLWPSFGRVARFARVSLDAVRREAGLAATGRATRAALGALLLARIDALRAQMRASLVFCYADSQFLPRGLFAGLRARGLWSAVMGLDDTHRLAPRREHGMWVGQRTLVGHVDLLWTTWPAAARLLAAAGTATWVAPEAADPAFHWAPPATAPRAARALFWGQAYGGRGALVRGLRARGVPVEAIGRGWPGGHLPFALGMARVHASAIVLGSAEAGCMADVQALKGRDFEMPMAGAAYVTRYSAELAAHFRIGEEILCYAHVDECAELCRDLLARPDRAAALRQAAAARARREHTWDRRLRAMLALFPGAATR